jgi:hypothetical protein
MSNNFPNCIYIIRHGEKLGNASNDKEGGPDLSVQGSARAAALPSLFLPTNVSCELALGSGNFTGQYATVSTVKPGSPRFLKPDFLFATQKSKSSNRPVETITPLSVATGLSINSSFPDSGFNDLAKLILAGQYAGKVVLVCWHHGEISALAGALSVSKPPKWKGTDFDFVWQITYTKGKANLKIHHQKLLFGDAK